MTIDIVTYTVNAFPQQRAQFMAEKCNNLKNKSTPKTALIVELKKSKKSKSGYKTQRFQQNGVQERTFG